MNRIPLHHYSKTSILFVVMMFVTATVTLTGQTLQQNLPIPNGSPYAIAFDSASNTIYLGGSFTYIGPYSGREAAIDTTTGNFDPAFPKVNARIRSIVLDGSGGHYIAGDFTTVGGLVRNRIAHIKADKSVDVNFDPNVNGEIHALVRSGSILYIGGSFTTVSGQARNSIAAIDAATGLATSWDPNANSEVWALAVSDSTVYAGGYFTTIGGQTRNHIAALDSATGSATTWNPNANGAVYTLADLGYGSTSIYVGGNFSTIGGQTRIGLAELYKSSGGATSWNPRAGGGDICSSLGCIEIFQRFLLLHTERGILCFNEENVALEIEFEIAECDIEKGFTREAPIRCADLPSIQLSRRISQYCYITIQIRNFFIVV